MDFLKKKMKELMDEENKPANPEKQNEQRDVNPSPPYGGQQQPYQQQPPQGFPQQHYPQPGGYPQQGYPPQASQQQPPYGQYGSPAPPQGPPAPYGAPPPMPPGWLAQWDHSSQRWFYVDQSTGRTQWDPPAASPPPQGPYAPPPLPPSGAPGAPGTPGAPGAPGTPGAAGSYYQGAPYGAPAGAPNGTPGAQDERALFGNTQGYNQGQAGNPGDTTGQDKDKDKSKKGHSTAMLAAVGVGGLAAGALIGHELTEHSEDDKKETTYVTNNYGAPTEPSFGAAPEPSFGAPPEPMFGAAAGFQQPDPFAARDVDRDSISSDEREELEERREELEERRRELREEQEELDEEIGETYEY